MPTHTIRLVCEPGRDPADGTPRGHEEESITVEADTLWGTRSLRNRVTRLREDKTPNDTLECTYHKIRICQSLNPNRDDRRWMAPVKTSVPKNNERCLNRVVYAPAKHPETAVVPMSEADKCSLSIKTKSNASVWVGVGQGKRVIRPAGEEFKVPYETRLVLFWQATGDPGTEYTITLKPASGKLTINGKHPIKLSIANSERMSAGNRYFSISRP